MRNPKKGTSSDAPSKKRRSHTLQVKQATIALKQQRLDAGEKSDYASTPEPNDPNRPYSPNHETSDESGDGDSE